MIPDIRWSGEPVRLSIHPPPLYRSIQLTYVFPSYRCRKYLCFLLCTRLSIWNGRYQVAVSCHCSRMNRYLREGFPVLPQWKCIPRKLVRQRTSHPPPPPPSSSSSSSSSSGRPSRGISIPCYAHPAVFRETNALEGISDAPVLCHAMHPLCLSLYICPTSDISPPHCKLMFPNRLSDPRYVIRQERGDAALHDDDGLFIRHDILRRCRDSFTMSMFWVR